MFSGTTDWSAGVPTAMPAYSAKALQNASGSRMLHSHSER